MNNEHIYLVVTEVFLSKFIGHPMNFLKWINCFEYIVDALRTPDDVKVTFLLNMVEPPVFNQIQEKLSPTDPLHLSYDELVCVLVEMFAIVQGSTATHYRFFARVQYPKEPIEHYVLALRKLFSKCDPAVKTNIDIKDRFIHGLEDEEIKAFLKKNSKDITFGIAVSIAKHKELASREIKLSFK